METVVDCCASGDILADRQTGKHAHTHRCTDHNTLQPLPWRQ